MVATVVVSARSRSGRLSWPLLADPADAIGRQVAATGEPYEASLLEASLALFAPGQTVVDVGSNIGNHSLFWRLAGGASVVAVEPSPIALAILQANMTLNSLDGDDSVEVMPVAVGAKAARVDVHYREGNLGASQIRESRNGPLFQTTLDQLLARKVALVKIDVEGMECEVLQGASRMLSCSRPAVWVEALDRRQLDELRVEFRRHEYLPIPLPLSSTNFLFFPSALAMARALGGGKSGRLRNRCARAILAAAKTTFRNRVQIISNRP